jgi:hypothetical protein
MHVAPYTAVAAAAAAGVPSAGPHAHTMFLVICMVDLGAYINYTDEHVST